MATHAKYADIDTIVFNREKFGPNSQLKSNHYHPFYELIHINSGAIRFLLKDTIYTLETGDTLLVAPREVHHPQLLPDTSCDVTYIHFKPCFIQQEVIEVFRAIHSGTTTSFIGTVPTIYQNDLSYLFNRLQVEGNSIDELSPHFMSLELSAILLFFMRHSILGCQELEKRNLPK